jgi:hypothetical protein
MKEMEARLARQVRVSKMLGLGFVFSLTPLAGVGSLVAFILGLKALRVIQRSEGEIVGMSMAVWCIATGATGMLLFPLLFLRALILSPG